MKTLEITIKKLNESNNLINRLGADIEPQSINRKVNKIFERIDNSKFQKEPLLSQSELQTLDQFIKMHEFEKHLLLTESLPSKFSSLAIKMAKSIIAEYKCSTSLEKSLVELIVNSFCRSLYLSSILVVVLEQKTVQIEQNFINYYKFIGKELDKANREYLTAITTLYQLKTPNIQLNLKADTAILGQNQQFNSLTGTNNENNKTN